MSTYNGGYSDGLAAGLAARANWYSPAEVEAEIQKIAQNYEREIAGLIAVRTALAAVVEELAPEHPLANADRRNQIAETGRSSYTLGK